MVKAFTLERVYQSSISLDQGLIPKTLKMVFAGFLLGVQCEKVNVKKILASRSWKRHLTGFMHHYMIDLWVVKTYVGTGQSNRCDN